MVTMILESILQADARLIAVAIDGLAHTKFAANVMQLAQQVETAEEEETHMHENLLVWPKVPKEYG